MKYFWFSCKEKDYQRAMGLYPAFILAGGGPKEFTSTTDHPVHSGVDGDHKLVYKTELY
jgi:hypothetical protein